MTGYLLCFVGGFGATLILSVMALRAYVHREIPDASALGVFLLPLTLVPALGGGGVGVLLYTLRRNPDPRLRLLCVLLLLFSLLTAVALWSLRRRQAARREAEEEQSRQAGRSQEARLLAEYAQQIAIVAGGDPAQVREGLTRSMPDYTTDSALIERTLALRRQDDPEDPLAAVSLLEVAVQTGNAEVVRLLLQAEGADAGRASQHQRAIAAAHGLQRPDLAALIRQHDALSLPSGVLLPEEGGGGEAP